MVMTTEEMLRRALELLHSTLERLDEIETRSQELLHSTSEQRAEIEARFGILEAKLTSAEPETVYQNEAAQFLRCSTRTLMRRRESGKLQQGILWWPEDGNGAPIYNLRLIRDGQRQGFDSPTHRRVCEQWLQQQPSNQKRKPKTIVLP